MKIIIEIIYNILSNRFNSKTQIIKLGRWDINYNKKIINRKVDLSNEDHCGPCGIYFKTNK